MYKIYKITNKANGKIYIGCTILTLKERLNAHYWKRNDNDTPLQRAFIKYGRESFDIIQIDTATTKEEMWLKEKIWIKQLDSRNQKIGYNLAVGGACLGRNATIDEKEANRRRNIGKECKPETRIKISLAQKGKPRPPEGMEKARLKKIGKKQTKEHIQKRALTRIGYVTSDETKSKQKLSNIGVRRGDETKKRCSESRKVFLSKHPHKDGHNIICLNNGKVYLSHQQAADILQIPRAGITSMVNGGRPHTRGYKFEKLTAEHLIF